MFTFLAYRYFLYLYVCFIIDKRLSFTNQFSYPQHFPTLIPVTSCQSIFATFALLLSSQAYDSSASSHFPLPFRSLPCIVLSFLVTMSLFAEAVCFLLCIHVHTASAYCFPFFAKLFVLLPVLGYDHCERILFLCTE